MQRLLVLSGESRLIDEWLISQGQEYTFLDQLADSQRYLVCPDFCLSNEQQAYLHQCRIDYALLPLHHFEELGLLVSDMDSTFITIECVDEIAATMGIQAQVASITEASMRGELDFVASLIERVALLSGTPIEVLLEIMHHKLILSPGAEFLLQACRECDVKFALVSGGFTLFTDYLKDQYHLSEVLANHLEIKNGRLTGRLLGPIVDAAAKAKALEDYAKKLGLNLVQTVAVGDGANDIPLLKRAGFSFAYHAKQKTRRAASVQINFSGLDFIRCCFI